MKKPIVALVGRPNVGKSTLFNRITKTKDAIVDNFPGVTRDRMFRDAQWNDVHFKIIDTGGLIQGNSDDLSDHIIFQAEKAIKESDVITFVLDGKSGLSPFDIDLIKMLRKTTKPIFYVVSKIDIFEQENRLYDFYQLGIEQIYPVSGEHGYGVGDFLDDLIKVLPQDNSKTFAEPELIKIAVVGKPNVGKSSLINNMLGEKRMVVNDIPGTTRDAVDTICNIGRKSYILIDTAGIRKKAKVFEKIEKFSIVKALKSLERCDIALIVMDAFDGINEQDIKIAGHAYERGCGCIFLINKWDLIKKDRKITKEFYDKINWEAKFLNFAPILTASALTGMRVKKIFEEVESVFAQYSKRIGTGQLNKIISSAVEKNEPKIDKGKRIKFFYATQTGIKPPTFVIFVNYPEGVHFSYERYIINQIRKEAGIDKTPIKIVFRKRTRRD